MYCAFLWFVLTVLAVNMDYVLVFAMQLGFVQGHVHACDYLFFPFFHQNKIGFSRFSTINNRVLYLIPCKCLLHCRQTQDLT